MPEQIPKVIYKRPKFRYRITKLMAILLVIRRWRVTGPGLRSLPKRLLKPELRTLAKRPSKVPARRLAPRRSKTNLKKKLSSRTTWMRHIQKMIKFWSK